MTLRGLAAGMLSEWRHDDGGGPGDLLVADPARVGSIFTHDPATYTQMLSAVDREGASRVVFATFTPTIASPLVQHQPGHAITVYLSCHLRRRLARRRLRV